MFLESISSQSYFYETNLSSFNVPILSESQIDFMERQVKRTVNMYDVALLGTSQSFLYYEITDFPKHNEKSGVTDGLIMHRDIIENTHGSLLRDLSNFPYCLSIS